VRSWKVFAALITLLVVAIIGVACGSGQNERESGAMDASSVSSPPSATKSLLEPTPTLVLPDICGSIINAFVEAMPDAETLAWVSNQVVTGTITQQLPSVKVQESAEIPHETIVTDYVVRVGGRIRGTPLNTVRVREPGGNVDGCVQSAPIEPSLSVGQRLLLFLGSPVKDATEPTYYLTGGPQGAWTVRDDGYLVIPDPRLQSAYGGMHLTDLTKLLRRSLEAGRPSSPIVSDTGVSLKQAPLAALSP